ncbi:MAG: type II secretion system minor pseudopilin GspJ [Gammaproteobacteria bacterium]
MTAPLNRQMAGFTLLELLIALAIFGLLSVMSYSGLKTVLDQHARTDAAADRLGEVQKIYLLMQRDIEQIVPRPVRGEYTDELPALEGSEVLQFTRGGWSNPLQHPRSNLQRVGYAFQDDELVRYTWQVLDRAQDSLPRQQPLTAAVTNMSVRYLSSADKWSVSWPPDDAGEPRLTPGGQPVSQLSELPKVIEITLEHEQLGELVWLFRLPQ